MAAELRIRTASIVLRGEFNPAIFHPAWLAANELIRRQEAESAKIDVVHPRVAQFTVAEWLHLMVTEDRFQVRTTLDAYYDPLRDLVLGVTDLLAATPVRQLGINGEFEFEFPSLEVWHAFGHRLAPKQPWGKLLIEPGMLNLIMEGRRPDDMEGHVQVHVGPCETFRYGIRIHVNDHYELATETRGVGGPEEAARVLSEQWRDSLSRSLNIAEGLVKEQS